MQEHPEISSGQLAKLLGVDPKTIHNWVGKGILRPRRSLSGQLKFLATEVLEDYRRAEATPPQKLVAAAGGAAC